VTLVLATVGYDLIHAAGRWLSIVALVAFVAIFVKLLTIGVPGDFKGSAVNYGTVLLVISIAASWQIAWAPYVSDYSRYLPADTTTSRTFWFTYLGSAVGASWCMIVGTLSCAIGADAYLANPSGYLADLFPTVSWLLSLVIFLTILPAQAESPYGCFLTLFAGLSVTGKTRSAPRARALFVLGFCIIGALLAIVAGSHIFTTLENFALFMLYLLVPWTSINLTDYYFVRHGSYRINDFFNPQGVFGMVRWETVIIYLAVIAIEIPFINTGLYVGPMVAKLGGADISWILGLIVGAGAYYLVAKWRGLGPMLESQPSEA
jgi:NCS1 family nucleobase:cation symporter-1